MRQTTRLCAADFKQKSRWSAVWPNMHYGAMYLNYGAARQMPMKGVNWVTRESNRLTNFSDRYASVIRDLDVKRNEDELKIPLSDVRWNDHRRLHWRCSFCGSTYRKNVSVRVKYHAGCNACKQRFPSEVLGAQRVSAALQEARPELKEALTVTPSSSGDSASSEEYRRNILSLSCTSKFNAEWKCQSCGLPYKATIRSRTGKVESGQAPLHPDICAWSAFCPSCRWKENMTPLAVRILKSGQYLGLEMEGDTDSDQRH